MLSEPDKAYIAALVDTLGRLWTRKVHADDLPVLTIQGKHEVLVWLAEATDVKLMTLDRAYTKHNCTEHCPSRHQDIASWTYRWELNGGKAIVLLAAIEPYLRIQGRAARALIEGSKDIAFKPKLVAEMQRVVGSNA